MKIITGMHRSGTSVIARLFYQSGADLGKEETFCTPDKWNPEGYFEQTDVHAINVPLVNGPWGKLSYLKLPSEKTILQRAGKISKRISAAAKKYNEKLVKETRFSLTLNAWRAHGANISKILICLREPIQTARSLHARNRVPIRHALHLWQEHYERLLLQTKDTPLWFIHYNNLLKENLYADEMTAAFRFLNYPLPPEKMHSLWKTLVKPEMNHHKVPSFSYPSGVEKLWKELQGKHRKQFS